MPAAAPPQRPDQLDLFGDYKANVAAYPRFHEYFRTHRPPTLAVWGRNDPFFLPAGAEAFRRDIPDAEVRFIEGGHFPLESHLDEVAGMIRALFARTLDLELRAAGFDRRAAVAIAMAVAGKTLVNTVAHLSRVEIDAGFQPGAAV
jgi:hypothetical protein